MNTTRVFSIKEQLRNIKNGAKGFVYMKRNKKKGFLNKTYKERIMLAVTQVNGCAMCSFVHTKIALSSGMTPDQIQELLQGNQDGVPVEQAVAVAFATHYADSKEQPSDEALDRLIDEYGFDNAECVIAASNMITMTNGMGISMDDLYHRLTFRRNKASNLLSELFNPLLTMALFIPFVIGYAIIGAFKNLPQMPKKRYNN